MVVGMAEVQALHLLQKDDVRIEMAQAVAQLMNHHLPIELGEAFVDVVGGDMQGGLYCAIGQCLAFPDIL